MIFFTSRLLLGISTWAEKAFLNILFVGEDNSCTVSFKAYLSLKTLHNHRVEDPFDSFQKSKFSGFLTETSIS